MKTARVYLPKKKLCESSGSYVKPAKNLFRSPATKNPAHFRERDFYFLLLTASLLPKNKIVNGIFGK